MDEAVILRLGWPSHLDDEENEIFLQDHHGVMAGPFLRDLCTSISCDRGCV